MMQKKTTEITVGLFVVAGIAALFMLAMKVSNLSEFTEQQGYDLVAEFDNIGGLKVRSPVTMAGVRVGRVSDIILDDESYSAKVTMNIYAKHNKIPVDTSASILTAGLLGEQYIGLEAGGDDDYLEEGGELELTQSAMVLEQIIGKFLFSKAEGE